jgi:tRNA (guanine9-N1)-methyltransferase
VNLHSNEGYGKSDWLAGFRFFNFRSTVDSPPPTFCQSQRNAMNEQERPRKLPKLDHGDENTLETPGPSMRQAGEVAGKEPESADALLANEPQDLSEFMVQNNKATNNESFAPADAEGAAPAMSKNQMKKLRKAERYQEKRAFLKSQKKDKLVEKKERRRKMFEEARAAGGQEAVNKLRETIRSTKPKQVRSTLIPLAFVMDCSYDDLMEERERISLAGQLTRSYSDNNRAIYHGRIMFSSFDKLLKERFDTVLWSHKNWKHIRIMQEDFVHAAGVAKEEMSGPRGGKLVGPFADQPDAKPEDGETIYLSSDSENILTELKPYSTYIVGALVDKNRHKAVCYKHAVAKGIKTAKLPIGQYIEMAHRPVLATNHVVEIMLKWLEVRDWGEAFMSVIPTRKGGALKGKRSEGEDVKEVAEDEDENEDANDEQIEAEQLKQLEEINAAEDGNEDEDESEKEQS